MNKEQFLSGFKVYFTQLGIYDYAGLAVVFLLFLLFFMLAIALKKNILAFLFFFLLALGLVGASPFLVDFSLSKTFKRYDINITHAEQLTYTDSVVVKGTLINRGKVAFKRCELTGKLIKPSKNQWVRQIYGLKPLRKQTMIINQPIAINASEEFRFAYENFRRTKGFDVLISASCW